MGRMEPCNMRALRLVRKFRSRTPYPCKHGSFPPCQGDTALRAASQWVRWSHRPCSSLCTLPSSLVLLPQKLPRQKLPNLLRPVHPLQKYHGHFHFFQPLFFQPDVEEAFGQEAVDPGFIRAVAADVDAAFQGEQDIKQPAAVLVEQGLFHGKHVQDVQLAPVHDGSESSAVLGIFFGNDGFHFVKVFFVMGVFVLAAHSFDVIVPLYGQDHIILAQQLFVIGTAEDGGLFLFQVVRMDPVSKVPTVMAQADIVALQILPGPVQPGQFAVMGILRRNVVPGIIRRISRNKLFPLSPHL